ncbi:MAG: type IV secretory system conjugative DNA transfer family protein, partial [Egibacteraceae bacterium]
RAACARGLAARSDTSVLGSPAVTALVTPAIAAASALRLVGAGCHLAGVTKGSPRARVLIGRRWRGLCRPLLAAESCASVICFGPPGSFKTGGLAIPAILEWEGPVVVPAIKPDVIHATIAWRSRPGRQLWIYNPLAAGRLASHTATPLASCRSWAGAKEMGSWLAQAVDLTGQSRDDVNYWTTLGGKLLAVLMYAAAGSGRAITDVVRWVDTQEEHEVNEALADLGCSATQDAWDACKGREQRTKSSVYGTAETLLDVFADPRVQRSASGCEIDIDQLLSGDHTLYLYAPPAQQRRLRPLFIALITAVVRRAQEQAATQPGGLLDPRLLLCLDEAGNIASIPDLPELATTGRGQGIALLSIFHDFGQVEARYGRNAHTVVNGHRGKLILSAQADLATLRLAAELIGEEDTTEASVSLRSPFPLPDEPDGRTVAKHFRPLLPADQIRQLPQRQGVLVYGNLPPTVVRLRAWWRTPGLRRRGSTGGLR